MTGTDTKDRSFRRNLRPILAELDIYDAPPADPTFVRLHANECPEPWPDEVMDDLADVIRGIELGRYPDTSGRMLREVLARDYGVTPAEVILGNGSDEVISLLVTALSGRPGATCVLPRPTFVMYAHAAKVAGLAVDEVDLTADLDLDEATLSARLARDEAAVCFLARPNNPTGSLWARDRIEALVRAHPHVVFVVDEAYVAYAGEPTMFRPDRPENLVVMGTLSKVGLAALRVGYCIAHPDLARALDTVRHPYNVSQTSLALACRVLTRHRGVLDALVARTRANRSRLSALLSRLPGARVHPSAGNMVLVGLPRPEVAATVRADLAKRRILVKDLSGTPGLDPRRGYLRASVGTSDELDRLEAVLDELGT
ncbi:MAG: aminotransferase class I/II-fold pyridoxal phosphate-dependent enzyme [Deltaproteobacteria bacterium]|nr:MAG: aminotransferase class I/II-fold pyridoxal phosphate-dependent enzyme [Deltaproteobacteria bacterium]